MDEYLHEIEIRCRLYLRYYVELVTPRIDVCKELSDFIAKKEGGSFTVAQTVHIPDQETEDLLGECFN